MVRSARKPRLLHQVLKITTMLISIEHLNKTYIMGAEKVEALKDVSINIEKGEYVALMGPSGSGKSTLMNLLGCLDSPSRGQYWLNGKEVSTMEDSELAEVRNKDIGFVFQTFNLLPRLSALENVALPLVYAGVSREDRLAKARKVLEAVGLGDRVSHKPNELSGGQRQRVAVARALVNDPAIILADEPTGNLDPDLSMEIMNLFQEFNRVGVTILVASHDISLISHFGCRVLRLHQGQLLTEN